MLHRLGRGFGQNGSTLNNGAPSLSTACLCLGCECPIEPAARIRMQPINKTGAYTRILLFPGIHGTPPLSRVWSRPRPSISPTNAVCKIIAGSLEPDLLFFPCTPSHRDGKNEKIPNGAPPEPL